MSYTGSVELISGITPKNGQGFPLVKAQDVYVDDTHRLPDALSDIHEDIDDKVSELRGNLSDEVADLRGDLSDVGNEVADLRDDLNDVGIGNAFDGELYNGYWNANGVLINYDGDVCPKRMIPCPAGAQVEIHCYTDIADVACFIAYFDSAGTTRVRRDVGDGLDYSDKAPDDAAFVVFTFEKAGVLNKDNVEGVKVYINNQLKQLTETTNDLNEDVANLSEDLESYKELTTYGYWELLTVDIQVGCFSKVGWQFYTTGWATNYSYARLSVSPGDKYLISGYGNSNAQAVMYFSGEPSQQTYIDGLGTTEQTYDNYEITVPRGTTLMLVQTYTSTKEIRVSKKINYTIPKTLLNKSYWEIKNGELTVVSKYTTDKDFVVKFGRRGPNLLPDFKTFSTCTNTSEVVSDGSNSDTFITDTTDWHSPFQVSAINNIDGDKPSSYNYTGGNHNYNNSGTPGENLATARNIYLKYYIDGVEVSGGNGYSDNIVAKWKNNIQGYNTIKANGTGREILTEYHELKFDKTKFTSSGYVEPLEDVRFLSYYGYQIYGLDIANVFDVGISFIGGLNRQQYTTLSEGHESGNDKCNGIEVVGTNHSCKLLLDTSYDLGQRTFYEGTGSCYSTTNHKAYTYLIKSTNASAGNRYHSRASWEFYPTISTT